MQRNRGLGLVLLALMSVACEKPQVMGRYYKGLDWIDFKIDGGVIHGESGSIAQYQIKGTQLVVFDPNGKTEGRLVNAATVEFPSGSGAIGEAFAGTWVARDNGDPAFRGEAGRKAATALLGGWRIPGETAVFEFRADGTYAWGELSGTYQMLDTRRFRMTVNKGNERIGELDNGFVVDGEELRLTAPDGAVTTYARVR